MNKKYIFWAIIATIVIVILLCAHYFPLWVSIATLISGGAGVVIGWIGKIFYDKYIRPVNQ